MQEMAYSGESVKAENAPAMHQPQLASDPIVKLTRVPCNLLGKVLERGRRSIHAAHLLAVKTSKGEGFVLNERHVASTYGISRWSFQIGMRLLKAAEVLERKQTGRRAYATETMAAQGQNFVLLDERLMAESSALVAFVLVANLSPVPIRPAQIGKRLGIKARDTLSRLTKRAIELRAVASTSGPRGAILLGRKGMAFDLPKNQPTKNQPTKIHPTHSRWKTDTENEKRAQSNERYGGGSNKGPAQRALTFDESSQVDQIDASKVLARLVATDRANTLSYRLRGDVPGLRQFLEKHGADSLQTMLCVLWRHIVDCKPAGSVKTWRYFESAIAEDAHLEELCREGIRPGDVLGAHRWRRPEESQQGPVALQVHLSPTGKGA